MSQGLDTPDRGSGGMSSVVPIPRGTAYLSHSQLSILRESIKVVFFSEGPVLTWGLLDFLDKLHLSS